LLHWYSVFMKLLSQLRDWFGFVGTGEEEQEMPPADKAEEVKPDNLLWKQYNVYVDLFKFYVDTTLKATTWFYAITGAILTYYFANADTSLFLLRFSLILPLLLSLGLCAIFALGVTQMQELDHNLNYIRKELRLPGKPHVNVLTWFLRLGTILFFFVSTGLLAVFIWS
jgi:hypothetical protein